MHIREFDEHKDMARLRECVIALQDFERGLDPRRPPGEEIADAYIPRMLERCKKCHGKIFLAVAALGGDVVTLGQFAQVGFECGFRLPCS